MTSLDLITTRCVVRSPRASFYQGSAEGLSTFVREFCALPGIAGSCKQLAGGGVIIYMDPSQLDVYNAVDCAVAWRAARPHRLLDVVSLRVGRCAFSAVPSVSPPATYII